MISHMQIKLAYSCMHIPILWRKKRMKKEKRMRHPFLVVVLALSVLFSTDARDTITPTQPLADNETLISSDGQYALGFFTPQQSNNRYVGLWYNQITVQTILWVANRENPVTNSTCTLSVTPNGSLTITSNQNSSVVWSTKATTGLANPVAQLLDNGNFVVKSEGDNESIDYAWEGFDYPTDTLIPEMRLGVDRSRGRNYTLVSWNAYNDPSAGQYTVFMDVEGDPEIYLSSGSTKLWRSGAWDGTHLSGIPDMTTYQDFNFSFVNDEQEVTYSYSISNQSLLSRVVANYTGVTQRSLWIWERNQWNAFWTGPQDQCDDTGHCGPNGVCDINTSPVCNCLQGFTPKNPANWNLKDGIDGCIRETALDCRNGNGTDGFVGVANVKLPQSHNATVVVGLGLAECEARCLMNCSCVAYATVNASGGGSSGCLMWVEELFDIRKYVGDGQEIFVRLAAADLVAVPSQSHHGKNATVVIVVSLVSGGLLLACVGCFLWRRKKKRTAKLGAITFFSAHTKVERQEGEEESLDIPLFDFGTIEAATDYFSSANKLGEGGFGPVYKGKLGEDQDIAVKRLAKTSLQGVEEFKNEVILIAKLQHRNLVRLLGCCIQEEERMLIYEYMSNKSLDAFLFRNVESTTLDWVTRYQIILGIARGLVYLHQDSRFRIIHRDLKASNILLDTEMNPKISDFGMARIFGGDETDFNTRKVVGTYGYMSPEYAMDGIFSVKSDVFSFGVLVLEIISGKKNRGLYAISPHQNLVAHAWSLWKEGKSLQLVDESMNYSYPMNEVLKCIKISLLCVQELPENRPSMSSVALMMGSSDIASLPQPKEPGFSARRGPSESSGNQDSRQLNKISITMTEGR